MELAIIIEEKLGDRFLPTRGSIIALWEELKKEGVSKKDFGRSVVAFYLLQGGNGEKIIRSALAEIGYKEVTTTSPTPLGGSQNQPNTRSEPMARFYFAGFF